MPDVPSWLISIFTILFTAFFGYLFGYLFAVKKFKKEKLWQEKYQTYQDILSALEAMILWANETYCSNKMIPTIGTHSLDKEKVICFAEARRVIAKVSCIGKLIISDEVIAELGLLEKALWGEDFRAEEENYHPDTSEESETIAKHAENIRKLVEPRLDNIIKYAKKDLA